jgi:hypothetical protein
MEENKFAVMIPCAQEDFASFISGLLGKPQTLERMHISSFEVNRLGIENLFHLIDQRLKQQNDATLLQFTVRIIYDDDSSVLLNSFEDFRQYVEVRPLISVGAQLSWTYLIRFQDRKVPEKQQIEVNFQSGRGGPIDLEFSAFEPMPWLGRGYVSTQVKHTARTWGVDIDSLLEGHIRTLARPVSTVRKWISRHSGKIGVISGLSFMSATVGGAYYSANVFLGQQLDRVQSFLQAKGAAPSVSDKLDFLLRLAAEGSWPRFAFMIGSFALFALLASIAFGILIGSTADNKPRSFVVLTEKTEENKLQMLRKEQAKWLSFIGSIITGVAIGVASNVVFSVSLAKWLAS